MKKTLLTTLLFCFSATFIFAQNLITNGGFETWTDQVAALPNSWVKGSGTIGTNYLYVSDVTQGNVLRLTDSGTGVGARRFNTTVDFSILTEGTYRVTFKVKGNVGLRGVILVNGTGTPSTSVSSATNLYTVISDYPSGTNVADWTTLQYDIIVPTTATFGSTWKLHFSWSSSLTAKPACDFQIDDISLVKYVAVPVIDDKLQSIVITPLGYTDGGYPTNLTIPGFNQNTLDYTFTSSYKDVPIVSATPVDGTATVDIVQATSLTGTQAERTATITVTTTNSQVKTYTVELIKSASFMSGISWNLRTDNLVEWESQSGLYTRDAESAGNIYAFGNTSARCNSSTTLGSLITPILVNGASSLTFYLKNKDIAGDNTELVVRRLTTASSPDWIEIGRIQPNISDYDNVWKQVSMNINDNSAGLQIRFDFEKTILTAGKVYLDDVLIQPYSPSTDLKNNQIDAFEVYAYNGKLIFNTSEKIAYTVFNLNGIKISEGISNQGKSLALAKGVYIVKMQDKSIKILL